MSKNLVKHEKSDKIKWIISFMLITILLIGFIGMAIALNREVDSVDLLSTSYEIGALDDSGAATESKTAIRTKDFYEVEGLKITVGKKATVSYKVYYYDVDKKFISASAAYDEAFEFKGTPENAKYFKAVITPDEGAEINAVDIYKYASQITVAVKR